MRQDKASAVVWRSPRDAHTHFRSRLRCHQATTVDIVVSDRKSLRKAAKVMGTTTGCLPVWVTGFGVA